MVEGEWVIDDPRIPDEAYVHRLVTDSQQLVYNDLLCRNVLNISAYSYRGDGMSVYVSTAMQALELSDDELMPYCAYGLARVAVGVVRRTDPGVSFSKHDVSMTVASGEQLETPGGVTLSPALGGPEDQRIRDSHGLVRIREKPVARPLWSAFRHKLLQGTELRLTTGSAWLGIAQVA